MAALPTADLALERYSPYIEELHEFFASSGLAFGTADNIFPLVERLQVSGLFTDDLASLIRSIILREGGAVPHARLLEILTVAIAGTQLEHPPEHLAEKPQEYLPENFPDHLQPSVRRLLAFIAGVLRRPWNEPPPESPSHKVAEPFAEEQKHVEHVENATLDSPDSQALMPLEFPGLSASLASALAAAKPESSAASASTSETSAPSPAPAARIAIEAAAEPAIEPARSSAKPRIELTPAELTPGFAVEPAVSSFSRTLLPDDLHRNFWTGRGVALTIAGAVTLVVVALALFSPDPTSLVKTASTLIKSASTLLKTASTLVKTASTQPSSQPAASPTTPAPIDSRDVPRQPPAPAPGIQHVAPPSTQANPTSLPAPNQLGAPRSASPTPQATSSQALGPAYDVSSQVMAPRLILERVPVYPPTARAAEVEGTVVLQTLISRDGYVVSAHVLSGDPMLRSAAIDAVRHWRYNPYLVDGQPVDVSTTVSLDFRLH